MSIYENIKDSLIKENKVLQVDYLSEKIVENSRDNFEEWENINPLTTKHKKLWEYLEKEDIHQAKYYRFKKTVNEKHFGLHLPEKYNESTILPLKEEDLLYSPRKIFSSALGNSTMDTSGGYFITTFDTIKEKHKKMEGRVSTSFNQRFLLKERKTISEKKEKNLNRYWPLEENESVIFQEKKSKEYARPLKQKKDQSIFNHSVSRSIKRSFNTIKSRPLSQQIHRHANQVENLVQKSFNPEIKKENIRQTLKSMTEKHKISDKKVKKERESILDTITNKEELMRFLRDSRSIDPKRKGIFSLDDLTEFEKFNLPFPKYMRLKSLKKINNYAYENKVKEKAGNLEKFQNFILEEFGIESDNKRKLEHIFEQIIWEFGRIERRKKAEKR